ncbi:hypothetical protein N7527_008014 [Penicillium freii]|nr:hypothetical protein N7527_008014 [Penicillium freii]
MDVQNMVEKHALGLLGNDINLTSLFTTDHHNSHDGADFLAAELGIFNKTIAELFPSPSFDFGDSALQARNPINGKCQSHGNIQDNLSQNQIIAVCATITAGAAGGVGKLIVVVDSKLCVEADFWHNIYWCHGQCLLPSIPQSLCVVPWRSYKGHREKRQFLRDDWIQLSE